MRARNRYAALLGCVPTPSPFYAYLRSANSEQTSLFSDNLHFSAAGQKIEADYIYSLIVAPSEISLLPENAVQMRLGLLTGIQEQLDIALQRPQSGFNVWANGGVSRLRDRNEDRGFPGETASTPISGAVGLNFVTPEGFLLGGSISAGSKKTGFDLGGDFTLDEVAVSLYGGYRLAGLWADAIGTFGALRYDVNRVVPVGITFQPNNGTTRGQDFSIAAQAGYTFGNGGILHGPVAGMVLQRVNVDGFAESGSFTNLRFEDQTRNSAVSALGYRAYFDWGTIQPFAQITWNHEWASADRLVTASLTTTIAPSYSLPAVQLGRDWGSGTVGARLRLRKDWTGLASFTTQVGQRGVTNYTGLLGLNYSFGSNQPVVAKY
jgi:outer membrane lipase/esterase